jgi:predicted nucleotidyltransferase
MATFAEYKRHWDEMALRDESLREHLRKDALRTARKMAGILVKEFGVTKVILFGSVVKEKSFDDSSDIDIAVEGLRKRAYFTALARLMMESQFEIDLKPLEDVGGALRQRIEKGMVLYEKRKNS